MKTTAVKTPKGTSMSKYNIYIIMAAALLVRLWATFGLNHWSHPVDMHTFSAWAHMLANNGFSAFYGSDAFTDYPPGYMYILGLTGNIAQWLELGFRSPAHGTLIKLPAMLFDIATVGFIYKIAVDFNKHRNFAAIAALIYAFNPAVILNSAIWGQVESIHTFLLVVSIYFIGQRKMLPSVLLFAVSIVVKPQSFMFAPIYLFMFYKYIFGENLPEFNPKKFGRLALYGLASFALIAVLILPFIDFGALPPSFLEIPIIAQYVDTFTTYPWITHNAYNIYALFGLNVTVLTTGIEILGYSFLVLVTLFAFYLLRKKNDTGSIFLVGAILVIGTFLLSIRMHERYNFPAIAFLLLAYVTLRDKRLLYAYAGYSAAHFLNNADVLIMSLNNFNWGQIAYTAVIFAIPLVAISVYTIYLAVNIIVTKSKALQITWPDFTKKYKDIILCGTITLFYAIFAFTNLGNMESPQSRFDANVGLPIVVEYGGEHELAPIQQMLMEHEANVFTIEFFIPDVGWQNARPPVLDMSTLLEWDFQTANEEAVATFARFTPTEHIIVDFGGTYEIAFVQHMLGARNHQAFHIDFSMDMISWSASSHLAMPTVFAWDFHNVQNFPARFARITPATTDFIVQEMGFRDEQFNLIPATVVSERGHELFDEQHLVPAQLRDYMHSAYFDEIYHPRTAYEFIHGMDVLEWSHPPLGKVIMSWGIQIFGMTPFGWRFAGAFFGVLMLPLIYAFAKAIFKKSEDSSFWASIVTFVFAFDFMHYAQTRLGTIDTYVVIFIMGMYYCMYLYSQMNFFHDGLRKTMLPLLCSGIFLGLAAASKWQGLYGAFGLAVIFFWTLGQRWWEYSGKKKAQEKSKVGIWDRGLGIYDDFWRKAVITCAACVGFFIIIPAAIYIVSYIPFWNTGYMHIDRMTWHAADAVHPELGFFASLWQNQMNMFDYHANLVADHPFSSTWYQWMVNYRPIWYYSNYAGVGRAQGISAFGNPLVWWTGLVALLYCIYAWIRRGDKTAAFLTIAWLSQILPWVFVPRLAFIYHYFPNVPFIVLMLAYMIKSSRVFESKFVTAIFSSRRNVAISFAVGTFALFILFYPVLTGTPISREFVNTYLRWFETWALLSQW